MLLLFLVYFCLLISVAHTYPKAEQEKETETETERASESETQVSKMRRAII